MALFPNFQGATSLCEVVTAIGVSTGPWKRYPQVGCCDLVGERLGGFTVRKVNVHCYIRAPLGATRRHITPADYHVVNFCSGAL